MKRKTGFSTLAVFFINFFYKLVFKENVSEAAIDFLKKLSFVTAGTLSASFISFIFNVLAGRKLGPDDYGQFVIIQSVTMFLIFPMHLGLETAMVKYASETSDRKSQSEIISTTYTTTLSVSILFVLLYYVLSCRLSKLFSISNEAFILAIIFAFLILCHRLAIGSLKGLHKMKLYAASQVLHSSILLSTFLIFLLGRFYSYRIAVYSMYAAYALTSLLIIVVFIRKFLAVKFSPSCLMYLSRFAVFSLIGMVCSLFDTQIDKILINKYMTLTDVGIYRAYSMASVSLVIMLFGTFNTVFFPTSSGHKNKRNIFDKINKLVPYIFFVGMPCLLLSQIIILKLYGKGYPISPLLILLFAFSGSLTFTGRFYGWFFTSIGRKGIRISTLFAATASVISVSMNFILIPLIGIVGAVTSSIIADILFISCIVTYGKRYFLLH